MLINAGAGTPARTQVSPTIEPLSGTPKYIKKSTEKRFRKRRPLTSQMEPKTAPKSLQNRRNCLPEASRRRFFTKTVDLHETLPGMVQTHVRPPRRAPFSLLLGPKVDQKVRPEGVKQIPTKKCQQVSNMIPLGSQNGDQNPSKIFKKSSLSHLGCPPAPFDLKKRSRRGGGPQCCSSDVPA